MIRTSTGRPDHLAADRGRDRVAKMPYPFITTLESPSTVHYNPLTEKRIHVEQSETEMYVYADQQGRKNAKPKGILMKKIPLITISAGFFIAFCQKFTGKLICFLLFQSEKPTHWSTAIRDVGQCSFSGIPFKFLWN